MKNLSFRTSLFLTTALLLMGCDQKTDTQAQHAGQDDITSFFSGYQTDTPPKTLSGNFLSGQFAQDHSDWDQASVYFSNILDGSPSEADIQRRVMALNMGAGHYDKAIDMAQKLVKQDKGDATLAHLIMALSYFKAAKYSESIKEIEGYKNDALGAAILPLFVSWAEAGQGKVDITELKKSPSLMYQAVLVAGFTKDKATISSLAKTYDFTKTPTPIARLEDIAAIFATNGEQDKAIEIYKALSSGIPERSAYFDQHIQHITDGTFKMYGEIDTPQIAMSDALIDMARILSNGYEDSARLFAHMALYLNPDNESSLELLAQIAADNHLFTKSIDYLTRVNTRNDQEKKIQITRSIAQMQVAAGQTGEAIRILDTLSETNKNIDAKIQIGDIYRSQDNFKMALEAYNAAYAMLDNKITAQYWELSFARGMTNERLKNWDQAEKDLNTALSFQPDQPYILNYLGYSWADQGIHLDKAAAMIEKAARLKPDDGAIIDSLGWIYFRMGQFDKAVITLEKAIELAPTEPEINDHLGDAYWRVGRKSEARFQWKRAVSFSKDGDITTKIQSKIDSGMPELPSLKPQEKSQASPPAEKIVETKK